MATGRRGVRRMVTPARSTCLGTACRAVLGEQVNFLKRYGGWRRIANPSPLLLSGRRRSRPIGSIGLCGGSYCRRASSDCNRQPHFSFQLDRFSINQNVGRNCAGLQIQHDWGEQVQTRPAADCKSIATRRLRGAGSAQRFSQITNPAEPHIVSADCKSSETYNLLQLNCRNACSASSRLQSAATTDYSGMVQRW